VRRDLDRERARRTADRDVEAESSRPERVLDLDSDRGEGSLQVGGADDYEVDVLSVTVGIDQRVARSLDRQLGLDAQLVVGSVRDVGAHPLGISQGPPRGRRCTWRPHRSA